MTEEANDGLDNSAGDGSAAKPRTETPAPTKMPSSVKQPTKQPTKLSAPTKPSTKTSASTTDGGGTGSASSLATDHLAVVVDAGVFVDGFVGADNFVGCFVSCFTDDDIFVGAGVSVSGFPALLSPAELSRPPFASSATSSLSSSSPVFLTLLSISNLFVK